MAFSGDNPWATRVAAKWASKQVSLTLTMNVGDPVWFGKYKNKAGIVVGFEKDPKGNPLVLVDPVPKGRKQTKAIQLFRVWYRKGEE